jgi:acetylornithine deacetylase/succinyl-diaminopimelate desuccinylase-like protein
MTFDFLSAAADLIGIDSRSSLSDRAVVDFLAPLCRAAGLQVQVQREVRHGVEQLNLLARHDGGDGAPLLLGTHLDTVPPGDPTLWTVSGGHPFVLTERDGDLYGIGSADVKLDFLCKLAALERLRHEAVRRPTILAGTYGEEVGRFGAELLVRELRPLPTVALVGEPTGLRPCTSHKGYVEVHVEGRPLQVKEEVDTPVWRLRLAGVPAHSSQPDRGVSANDLLLDALPGLMRGGARVLTIAGGEVVNAVCPSAEAVVAAPHLPDVIGAVVDPVAKAARVSCPPLADALVRIHGLTRELRGSLAEHVVAGFQPSCSTVNNGLLTLGPKGFRYVADVRLLPGEAPRRALDAYLRRLRHERTDGVELSVGTRLAAPPFVARPDSLAARALEGALAERSLATSAELKSGTTEATVYAQAGIDTVVFGPGAAAGIIHKPDEHVPLAHLHTATDVYEAVIRRLCL